MATYSEFFKLWTEDRKLRLIESAPINKHRQSVARRRAAQSKRKAESDAR